MKLASSKIQIDYLESNLATLSPDQVNKVEMASILGFASDFMRGRDIRRISKVSIPLYLSKTKTGKYIAFNPLSDHVLKVPITQLVSLQEIRDYCKEEKNLVYEKLYKKMLNFTTEEVELIGGVPSKQIPIVEYMLKVPRGDRKDFKPLKITANNEELKEQLQKINDLVYDEKSINEAINKRLNIIDKSLKEKVTELENYYVEREKHWKLEIENAESNLKRRLKDREKQLDKDIKDLESQTAKDLKNNMGNFLKGVAKNIRKDEKPVEKEIAKLESMTKDTPNRELVENIRRQLDALKGNTEILMASVEFAMKECELVQNNEMDILELADLEEQRLKEIAELEKQALIDDSKKLDKNRKAELKDIKRRTEALEDKYLRFSDNKSKWASEIKSSLSSKGTTMIDPSVLQISQNSNMVELHMPVYLIQYERKDILENIAVPPGKLPKNFKKPEREDFFGPEKSVYFTPVIPLSSNFLVKWIENVQEDVDFDNALANIPNLLDDPKELREIFFTSKALMLDTLRVNNKKWSKVNEKLTVVFSS